ncbi:MAG: tryptophan--tRNA ligase, partial [Enterococcus sp.]|nr:tryptophan--tRNA ligase [Enterococcus sp.]
MSDTFEAQKKLSDKIRLKIEDNPQDFCMLTGDRPTGRLHMGHYFGTIKERVALQNKGIKTYIVIADYQVITDRDATDQIEDNVLNMVIDYLACGIDPEKTIIFTHSAIPALNQLLLPFLSLVTEAELMRNPTVKAEQEVSGHALTGLFLTYPVHQACDILFCNGDIVPVGKDQLPHIELSRLIAKRFNNRYGKVFKEPIGLLTNSPDIPGLDGRKMSKSYGNAISLSYSDEDTAKLIKKSQTDSERKITFDPVNRPGVSALLTTASLCTGRSEQEIAQEIGDAGSGALKQYVTESVNSCFTPIREKRRSLESNISMIREILHEGNRRANIVAENTLNKVLESINMK